MPGTIQWLNWHLGFKFSLAELGSSPLCYSAAGSFLVWFFFMFMLRSRHIFSRSCQSGCCPTFCHLQLLWLLSFTSSPSALGPESLFQSRPFSSLSAPPHSFLSLYPSLKHSYPSCQSEKSFWLLFPSPPLNSVIPLLSVEVPFYCIYL